VARFNRPDGITLGEWRYLQARYSEAEAKERRARIGATIARLVRQGKSANAIHRGVMIGIDLWLTNHRRYAVAVTRARRDLARAAASLRRLLMLAVPPPELISDDEPGARSVLRDVHDRLSQMSDDEVIDVRDQILPSPPAAPRRRGRPTAEWRHVAEDWLQKADVGQGDRRELLTEFGFLDDE
jgi:hypothetical protein